MLIISESGGDKSTLITKWLEYHKSSYHIREKNYIMLHFTKKSHADFVYFQTLYRTFVKSRQDFDIK